MEKFVGEMEPFWANLISGPLVVLGWSKIEAKPFGVTAASPAPPQPRLQRARPGFQGWKIQTNSLGKATFSLEKPKESSRVTLEHPKRGVPKSPMVSAAAGESPALRDSPVGIFWDQQRPQVPHLDLGSLPDAPPGSGVIPGCPTWIWGHSQISHPDLGSRPPHPPGRGLCPVSSQTSSPPIFRVKNNHRGYPTASRVSPARQERT